MRWLSRCQPGLKSSEGLIRAGASPARMAYSHGCRLWAEGLGPSLAILSAGFFSILTHFRCHTPSLPEYLWLTQVSPAQCGRSQGRGYQDVKFMGPGAGLPQWSLSPTCSFSMEDSGVQINPVFKSVLRTPAGGELLTPWLHFLWTCLWGPLGGRAPTVSQDDSISDEVVCAGGQQGTGVRELGPCRRVELDSNPECRISDWGTLGNWLNLSECKMD